MPRSRRRWLLFAAREVEPLLTLAERSWGDGTFTGSLFAPGDVGPRLGFFAGFEREGASPGAMIALVRMLVEIDVRDVLPLIAVPTLIVHRNGDAVARSRGRATWPSEVAKANRGHSTPARPTSSFFP